MVKNFLLKRGDQLAFTITFTSATPVSAMEFGVKQKYSDDYYTIIKSLYAQPRNVIFIGDSYLEGYTPDGHITSWGNLVKDLLPSNQYNIRYKGGTGFAYTVDNQNFVTLLNDIPSSDAVTDIIVCGGYNDRYCNNNEILVGISNFYKIASNKFPNASVKIGMVGWSYVSGQQDSLNRVIGAYKEGCNQTGCSYMSNVENSIHNPAYMSSDKIHPNELGQEKIAENIVPYLPTIYAGGIEKVSDYKYKIVVPSSDMNKLDAKNYVYDLRIKVGTEVRTPLSGKLMIKDTVFED